MVEAKFSKGDYLRQMIEYTLWLDERRRWPVKVDDKFFANFKKTDFLVPLGAKEEANESKEWSISGPMVFDWIYQNAEFMRWSVVDESIPLQDKDTVFGLFDGCRRTNVIALWMLKYWPALPELREAMLHESDSYLRQLCVETIGVMGARGLSYAKDIRDSITKYYDDQQYQREAVKVLRRLNDIESVSLLRELFEITRSRIDCLPLHEANLKDNGSFMLVYEIITALIKFDPPTAREILAMELIDPNPHVYHFIRNAFKFSSLSQELELIQSSRAAIVSFLPTDPKWIFQRESQALRARLP